MPRRAKSKAPQDTPQSVLSEADLGGNETDAPDIAVFRPDREGIRKVLGDLEADIMEYVWIHTPPASVGVTVREVYEDFRLHRIIAYTTVMNTMARLARKKLLRFQKIDTAYVYSPSMSRIEFIDNFVSRILENLLVNFADPAETHLQRLSTPENSDRIAQLRARIAESRTTLTGDTEKESQP